MQANRVDKQLHIMFHNDLFPNLSPLRDKSEGGMSIGMSEEVGRAIDERNERYSKVKRITILPALVELKGFQTSRRACYFICENSRVRPVGVQYPVLSRLIVHRV